MSKYLVTATFEIDADDPITAIICAVGPENTIDRYRMKTAEARQIVESLRPREPLPPLHFEDGPDAEPEHEFAPGDAVRWIKSGRVAGLIVRPNDAMFEGAPPPPKNAEHLVVFPGAGRVAWLNGDELILVEEEMGS